MQAESSFNKFWLNKKKKKIKYKIQKSHNSKKINKTDTALTHVWLYPVKIVLERPGEKQMICDGHPGSSLFEKPRSNRLTLVSA